MTLPAVAVDPVQPAAAEEAVEFVQSHEPPLPRGDYRLTMRQSVTVAGATHEFSTRRRFLVRGSRALQPNDVVAVFPPQEQLGEYSHALPHVVLARSTMPWERSAVPGSGVPWLALLLFADDEVPVPAVVPLSALRAAGPAAPWWPGLPAEEGEDESAKVTVIDVPRGLLDVQLPDGADLATLTHVRRQIGSPAGDGTGTGSATGGDTAVVVGGRLPVPGGRSTAHLVSLENRYAGGQDPMRATFDLGSAADGDLVRLVSLLSWTFSCVEPVETFSHLVANLDPYGGSATGSPTNLRLPSPSDPTAERYLAGGNVPLPHRLRDGTNTVSWYRGPLVPGAPTPSPGPPVPARAADALLRYDPSTGLLDASYAAAWELGRLLTLASRQVSTSLYLYKRQRVQQVRATAQTDATHLPIPTPATADADSDPATTVRTWFAALRTLVGVPFLYLVPDERLLPAESLRFFSLDPAWVRCLLDGAYSIGRVTPADAGHDAALPEPLVDPGPVLSGVLVRSAAVRGWPDLEVVGTDADGAMLPVARRWQPAPDLLLVLFEGEVSTLGVAERAQGLHLGFDVGDTPSELSKRLRNPANGHQQSDQLVLDAVPWRDAAARVLDIEALRAAIDSRIGAGAGGASTTSAQFALQMVEGVQQVIFPR